MSSFFSWGRRTSKDHILNISDSNELFLDTETKYYTNKLCKDVSEYFHNFANEPSVGLFRVQEHVRKIVPHIVKTKQVTQQKFNHIQEVTTDVSYAIEAVEDLNKIDRFPSVSKKLHGWKESMKLTYKQRQAELSVSSGSTLDFFKQQHEQLRQMASRTLASNSGLSNNSDQQASNQISDEKPNNDNDSDLIDFENGDNNNDNDNDKNNNNNNNNNDNDNDNKKNQIQNDQEDKTNMKHDIDDNQKTEENEITDSSISNKSNETETQKQTENQSFENMNNESEPRNNDPVEKEGESKEEKEDEKYSNSTQSESNTQNNDQFESSTQDSEPFSKSPSKPKKKKKKKKKKKESSNKDFELTPKSF